MALASVGRHRSAKKMLHQNFAVVPSLQVVLLTRETRSHEHGNVCTLPGSSMTIRRKSAHKGKKTEEIVIPEKLYFRIGEVARLFRLPAYVLRFWETEFPQLKPIKSSTGQRMYRRRDLDSILKIKQLLYEQGFTIAGARQQIREEASTEKKQAPLPFPSRNPANLAHIRNGLQEILGILSARR